MYFGSHEPFYASRSLTLTKKMHPPRDIWYSMYHRVKVSRVPMDKSHCGDTTVVKSSYFHDGISYTGKMTSLYWISPQHAIVLFVAEHTHMFRSLGDRCTNGKPSDTTWSRNLVECTEFVESISIFQLLRNFAQGVGYQLFILRSYPTNGSLLVVFMGGHHSPQTALCFPIVKFVCA